MRLLWVASSLFLSEKEDSRHEGGNVARRLGSQPAVSKLLALSQGRDLRVHAHSWPQ